MRSTHRATEPGPQGTLASSSPRSAAPPAKLFNRNFILLWQGQAVSQLGNQAFSLAMMYWLMEATGSASIMGLLMVCSALPAVILAPFGGALADRVPRVTLIVASDLIRGAATLMLAAFMFLQPEARESMITALFAVTLFGGVIGAVFQPAVIAAIPDVVPASKLAAANSISQISTQGSMLVGQAIGGLLYQWLGAATLFALNGLSFILSGISEMFIRLPIEAKSENAEEVKKLTLKEHFAQNRRDTAEGLRFVWERKGMRVLLLLAAAVNFFAMPVVVLLPFFVNQRLGAGPQWYGFILSALGGGAVVGYLLVGAFKISSRNRPVVVFFSLLTTAAGIAASGLIRQPWLALVAFFLVGMSTGAVNIFLVTLFQLSTPKAMRGRVMASMITLSGGAAPLGMALGGFLGDVTDKNVPLIYGACGLLIGLLTLGAAPGASLRSFLAWKSPEDVVEPQQEAAAPAERELAESSEDSSRA